MPRVVKSKSTEPKVAEPVSQVETVVLEKTVKAKKTRAPKSEVNVELVTTQAVTIETISVAPVVLETEPDVNISVQSDEFFSSLQKIGVALSSLKAEYRVLEKKWTRELKLAQKKSSKNKRKCGNRAPSGFVKPTRISDELATFLEKPTGSEMARTEVTRDINKYIRSNNLQDKDNGRKINPDTKLAGLLKLNKTDELTYFNLQRYMSPHFAKANKDLVTASVVTTSV
jgi:upstream activation factor subunit UAF30